MIRAGLALVAAVLLALPAAASAQEAQAPPVSPCAESFPGSADLYCLELVPVPELQSASGSVLLGRTRTPFGASVAADGSQRYDLRMWLDDLPPPDSLGPYSTYVAWATTPRLKPMVRLGAVREGKNDLGTVALDKLLVLVSAERDSGVERRRGRLVLRGTSASMRLRPHELVGRLSGAMGPSRGEASDTTASDAAARRPPMHPEIQPIVAVSDLSPWTTPYLPAAGDRTPPPARPREVRRMSDGDTLRLAAEVVRRRIGGREFVMYGYNGQYPGPLIHVPRGAEITVLFRNEIDLPTTVHWHGLRLENGSDGVPEITQEPVPPGGSFVYTLRFPDAGIYWYHPHLREDVQQDLGLYGNMLVDPDSSGREEPYYNPVNREEVLMLDDLLVADAGLVPYGEESPTHAMMGRFGNVLLVNGEEDYRLRVERGSVVRFFLTNVSNTRTLNLSFGDARVKAIASDVSRFEEEQWVESVVLAPAQRYVVEVRFPEAGTYPLVNRVKGIDRRFGRFFAEVDTLGTVEVAAPSADPDLGADFRTLRDHDAVRREIDRFRRHFERPPDHELVLTLETEGLPYAVKALMRADSSYFHPVEWTRNMAVMNWLTTAREVRWILRDPETGRENMEIGWRFRENEVVKVRLRNERDAFHAMQHPIHLHGQRFLVLSRNGEPNDNLVWKDTMLMPVGSTAEILLELSNPGDWMLHCHISEHLQSGMKTVFTVEDVPDGPEPGDVHGGETHDREKR